jgi:pimeloyl-ACP methyl ester carboxylesterase
MIQRMEIAAGSAVLAAESHGTGDPVVLLLHAGVTDQRSWAGVIDALPAHRCLTYDARGYGRTTYEKDDGWSSVEDAIAVLDAYDVPAAVVVGSSVGGRTALDLALTQPDRVRALVLVAPAISGAPEPVHEPAVDTLGKRQEELWEQGDLDEVNRIDARIWLDGPSAPEGRVTGEARELFLDMNRVALAAEQPGEERRDVAAWHRLAEIQVPTLLLLGELDLGYLADHSRHAAEQIPGSRLLTLPGVAHLPHLEGDPTTLREIAAFIDSL